MRLNGCLELDVLHFDCHSKMITNDLRKTLKAEDYPGMVIRFLSLERAPSLQGTAQTLKGWVEVEQERAGAVKVKDEFAADFNLRLAPLR